MVEDTRESAEIMPVLRSVMAELGFDLRETGSYYATGVDGRADNVIIIRPRSYGVRLDLRLPKGHTVIRRCEDLGLSVLDHRGDDPGPGTYPLQLRDRDIRIRQELIEEAMAAAGAYTRS